MARRPCEHAPLRYEYPRRDVENSYKDVYGADRVRCRGMLAAPASATYHQHTFKVEAIDADGNVDKSPAKDKFTIVS